MTSHLPLRRGDAVGQPRKFQKNSPQQNFASLESPCTAVDSKISPQRSLYLRSSISSCLGDERPSNRRPGKPSSVSKPSLSLRSTQDRCLEPDEVTNDTGSALRPKRYVSVVRATPAVPVHPAFRDAFPVSPGPRRSFLPVKRQTSRLITTNRYIPRASPISAQETKTCLREKTGYVH